MVVGPARYGQLLRKGTVVKPMVDDDDDVPGPFFPQGFRSGLSKRKKL